MGEYSTSYLLTKKAIAQKNKINKLENSFPNNTNDDMLKTEKERYLKEVTDKPEFDQALEHLMYSVDGKGSDADIEIIKQIKGKNKKGNLDYSDIRCLQTTVDRNFKYFFVKEPESSVASSPCIFGTILIIAAILLRIFYELGDSNTLVLFLALINIIAICYTLICIKDQVSNNVEQWLRTNNFPPSLQQKFLDIINRKMMITFIASFVMLSSWLIISFLLDFFSLGNDIVSILSLGISILTNEVVNALTRYFEKRMYHNY